MTNQERKSGQRGSIQKAMDKWNRMVSYSWSDTNIFSLTSWLQLYSVSIVGSSIFLCRFFPGYWHCLLASNSQSHSHILKIPTWGSTEFFDVATLILFPFSFPHIILPSLGTLCTLISNDLFLAPNFADIRKSLLTSHLQKTVEVCLQIQDTHATFLLSKIGLFWYNSCLLTVI